MEMHAPSAEIHALLAARTHHGAKAREQRTVHARVARRLPLRHHTQVGRAIRDLGVDIVPFGQPQQRESPLLAPDPQFAPRSLACLAVRPPELDQRRELGLVVLESGALTRIPRPARSGYADVRDAQARDYGQQFALGAKALALEQRPRQARVERQPRHGTAAAGDPSIGIQRLDLLQQPVPVAERPRIGRVDERKILRLAQAVGSQAQEQCGKIRAQYFGFGVGSAPIEVGLRVQPQTESRPQAAAPALALVGAGARYGFYRQSLEAAARAVAADA